MKYPNTIRAVRRLIAAVSLLTLIPLIYQVIFLDIIPIRFLLMIFPLYILVTTAAAVVTFLAKPAKRKLIISCIIISVLAIATNLVAYQSIRSATSLFNSIQQNPVSYVDYSIITKKGSGVALDSAQAGAVIAIDPLHDSVVRALKNETPAESQDYENIMASFDGLLNTDDIQIATIRSSVLALLRTDNQDLYDQIDVIGNFRVKDTSTNRDVVTTDTSKPFALYISGIDTYGDISTESRSDVNILAIVNPKSRKIILINTPRDYYVQLHGTTGLRDKLTHAGTYGIEHSRKTLEDLYGITIPYHARINFTSLVKIIDTIGPIDVRSDYAFKSYRQGMNTLNSSQALEFSRERYSFEAGDRQRGQNQQYVITAIIAKLSRPENAAKLPQIISAVENSIETNMSEASLRTLVHAQLDDVRAWHVESVSVDGSGATLPTYTYGRAPLYVMIPDEATVEFAKRKITSNLN